MGSGLFDLDQGAGKVLGVEEQHRLAVRADLRLAVAQHPRALGDPDALGESVRRAVRAALNEQWGKKPICVVHVLTV